MIKPIDTLYGSSVGEVAAQLPGASGVFRRFGIDFCCQSHIPLRDVA